MRVSFQRAILGVLRAGSPRTIVELVAETRLARPTVVKHLKPLLEEGEL